MRIEERNISLDVIRTFAIFGVITLHVLGGVQSLSLNTGNRLVIDLLLAFFYCSVNLFGLLSGYLKVDRKQHNDSILKILFQTFFWCIFIGIISALFFRQNSFNQVVNNLFPILQNRFWYITCYTFVFFLFPYINKTITGINEREYGTLIVILFIALSLITTFVNKDVFRVVNNGYSAIWLAYMYLLGSYIKKFGFKIELKRCVAVLLLIVCVFSIVLTKYAIITFFPPVDSLIFYYYCSPLTLCVSILVFRILLEIKIKSKVISRVITWFSTVSLGVYVIHAHPFVLDNILIGDNLKWVVFDNPLLSLLLVVGLIIIIGIVTGVLEQIRILLFRLLKLDVITKNAGKKLDVILDVSLKNNSSDL